KLKAIKLNISRIIVVDNAVAKNTIEKQVLKLATPSGVKLSVLPVEKAANNILAGKYDSQRLLIITKNPGVYLELVEAGVPIKEINVGNMSQSDQTKSITKSINVTDKHIEAFKKLEEKNIQIVAQMIPGDRKQNFMNLLKSRN